MSKGLEARELFETLPSGKTREEVAKLLNCSVPTALRWGCYFGYAFSIKPRYNAYPYNWNLVNWEDNDSTISCQIGCTKEGVRLKRIALGAGKSPYYGKKQGIIKPIVEMISRIISENGSSGLKVSQMSERTGISVINIRRIGESIGYEFKKEVEQWHLSCDINWDLPNARLAEIWRPNSNCNAGQSTLGSMRFTDGHPPKWSMLKNRDKANPEYLEALRLEKLKVIEPDSPLTHVLDDVPS